MHKTKHTRNSSSVNNIKILWLLPLALFLYGCASGAKFENMAYTETSELDYDESLKSEIELSGVEGGKKTNPLWTSEISNEAFHEAVELSLFSQGLMSEEGRYQLKIKLIEVDQPMFGLDIKVTTHVNYVLIDTEVNKIVFDEIIVSPYTATVGNAIIAVQRLRLANEGSGKSNIEAFFNKLSSLNLSANSVSLKK